MNNKTNQDLGDKVTGSQAQVQVQKTVQVINKQTNLNNMKTHNTITPENLLIEKSSLGPFYSDKMNSYIESLTEEEEANFDKFIRHIKSGLPIDFNQRKMIDRAGKPYYFINQLLNGNARSGYKLIILEGFDLFLERIMTETIGFDSLADIKAELTK
ncbi:hypothetical protein [Sphingobacterium sp. UDSM-2020]|uniref:hypothetical protein n=1 Tax=Sphingobacterium sp. UDSM-2020 TaxID=2795738 RepID=UPI001934CCF2|nr:hypothetical protein [Sphingobacterium sp. UDSM-2020]QQD15227.1 hypothetical protein JAZ75_06825 [Sphingobacterium sp. UDSM-2020]